MIEQTYEKLNFLRLFSFTKALRAQMESTQYAALSFEERLSLLVEEEMLARGNSRLAGISKMPNSNSTAALRMLTSRGLAISGVRNSWSSHSAAGSSRGRT